MTLSILFHRLQQTVTDENRTTVDNKVHRRMYHGLTAYGANVNSAPVKLSYCTHLIQFPTELLSTTVLVTTETNYRFQINLVYLLSSKTER